MCYAKPDYPDIPQMAPPPAPDMSGTYRLAAEAQEAQNIIAAGQTDLARRQGAIAEERYDLWKEGYLPVERRALKDLRGGIDVEGMRSRSRNVAMQRTGPELTMEARRSSTLRGITADSPAAVGGIRTKQSQKGSEIALADLSAEDRARALERAKLAQGVSIGSGLPSEVISGYGTAAGVMGSAGERIGSAASSAIGVSSALSQAEQEIQMQGWQNSYQTALQQYQLDMVKAQQEAAAQNQMVNTGIGVAAMVIVKIMFSCIPERTFVDTPRGPQRIETLRVGDRVIGSEGNEVTVLMAHEYLEPSPSPDRWFELRLERGGLLRACDEHLVAGQPMKEWIYLPEIAGQRIVSWANVEHVQRSYDLLTTAGDGGYRIAGVPVQTMIPRLAERVSFVIEAMKGAAP